MINVWVLFILTHGGMVPIMEFKEESSCHKYQQQYNKTFETQCHYLMRKDIPFRPKEYGK